MVDQKYDIEFITYSLGLVPICGGAVAINVGAIKCIHKRLEGGWRLSIDEKHEYDIRDEDMAELERTIKARMSAAMATGGVIIGAKPGGRFRQQ